MEIKFNNQFFNNSEKNVLILGGNGGLGESIKNLLNKDNNVFVSTRHKNSNDKKSYFLDATKQSSWENMCKIFYKKKLKFDLIINCIGILHDKDKNLFPEKSIKEITSEKFLTNIKINTLSTALSLKYLINYFGNNKSIYASLTARLGSINDNNIGGWISYRASKAAEHMVLKTASIETKRIKNKLIIVGLHPGTVATDLSKPYTRNSKKVFSTDVSARKIYNVINNLRPEAHGKIFDYLGNIIPY